jgi:hypothetical protein
MAQYHPLDASRTVEDVLIVTEKEVPFAIVRIAYMHACKAKQSQAIAAIKQYIPFPSGP